MPRLVICTKCRTIEDIPLDQVPIEERQRRGDPEPLLLQVMERHNHGPMRMNGPDADMMLVTVPDEVWDEPRNNYQVRNEILANIKNTWSGFEPEFYATKQTFVEDAGRCFSQHQRPKEGCIDYHNIEKLLTPGAWSDEDEKAALGELTVKQRAQVAELTAQRKPVYLCDFCVVSSYVTFKVRDSRGMYK